MKRQRGRGRKPTHSSNRSLESNGPEVKIRGSASQIYEKYIQYARDAQTAGDRVKAENLFQHAEHYYRIMQANMPKDRPAQNQNNRDDDQNENTGEETSSEEASVSGAMVDDPMKVVDEVDASNDSNGEETKPAVEEEAPPPKKRTRRPRRKPAEAAEQPQADAQARSALDALAEQQAEIAGN
ncbi:DUF4167 domain-containing protein [Hirschia litorea]|uniref:DUF4167 domain-containing protein n=1 Tax=Hirschia litorea TaxID=1199156 RepID=A0ABW2IK34_9PROT